MPRVSLWFFAVAVLYAIAGMAWGMQMAGSGDHSMFPAHAHLNLIGWVGMAIYGTFYALARDQTSTRLAWIVFAVSNVGTIIMIPTLAILLAHGEDPQYMMPVAIGAGIVFVGMILFAVSVWMLLLKKPK